MQVTIANKSINHTYQRNQFHDWTGANNTSQNVTVKKKKKNTKTNLMSLSFWFVLLSEGTLQVPEHIVNNLPFLPQVISTGFLLITRERERGKKNVHVFIRRQGIHVDIGLHVCIYI